MTGPSSGKVVVGQLHRVRRGRRKTFASEAPQGPVVRPTRVAVQLALAHQIRKAIDSGEVADQGAVARQMGLTRARLTQLLGLTLLAPEIQERVLGLESVDGVEPLSERALREAAWELSWAKQRVGFGKSRPREAAHPAKTSVWTKRETIAKS